MSRPCLSPSSRGKGGRGSTFSLLEKNDYTPSDRNVKFEGIVNHSPSGFCSRGYRTEEQVTRGTNRHFFVSSLGPESLFVVER